MRVRYVAPESRYYTQYYQNGRGVFRGVQYQRGGGIGSFFRSIGRFVMPLLRPVLGHAVQMGRDIATDVMGGQDLGQTVRKRAREAGGNLLSSAAQSLRQQGSGRFKRKRPSGKSAIAKKRRTVTDIFNGANTQRIARLHSV